MENMIGVEGLGAVAAATAAYTVYNSGVLGEIGGAVWDRAGKVTNFFRKTAPSVAPEMAKTESRAMIAKGLLESQDEGSYARRLLGENLTDAELEALLDGNSNLLNMDALEEKYIATFGRDVVVVVQGGVEEAHVENDPATGLVVDGQGDIPPIGPGDNGDVPAGIPAELREGDDASVGQAASEEEEDDEEGEASSVNSYRDLSLSPVEHEDDNALLVEGDAHVNREMTPLPSQVDVLPPAQGQPVSSQGPPAPLQERSVPPQELAVPDAPPQGGPAPKKKVSVPPPVMRAKAAKPAVKGDPVEVEVKKRSWEVVKGYLKVQDEDGFVKTFMKGTGQFLLVVLFPISLFVRFLACPAIDYFRKIEQIKPVAE